MVLLWENKEFLTGNPGRVGGKEVKWQQRARGRNEEWEGCRETASRGDTNWVIKQKKDYVFCRKSSCLPRDSCCWGGQ